MTSRSLLNRLAISAAIVLIRAYKTVIAPLWIGGCRHYPTCSDYAIDALRLKGIGAGSKLAFRRILRCRPGGTYGYDPVEHAN